MDFYQHSPFYFRLSFSNGKVKEWAGALENYTLKEADGITTLTVDIDIVDEFKDYFMKAFPGGLEQVKQLSEK